MQTSKQMFITNTQFIADVMDLGSEVRINIDASGSLSQSLVFNEVLQLKEAPVINPVVESFSSLASPNSLEVLHYNSIPFINATDNSFTNIVVYPSLETSLSSRPLLEKFSGASSAFGLKFFPQSLELEHFSFDLATSEELFIRGNSYMIYSDINTNFPVATSANVNVFGKGDVDKESSLFIHKNLGSLPRPVKILSVIFRNANRDVNSAINCSYPNFIWSKCKSSLIKIQRHIPAVTVLRNVGKLTTERVIPE